MVRKINVVTAGGQNDVGIELTHRESSALYGLLAQTPSDIIFKTDLDGYIVHASAAIEQLGISIPSMLIGPHVRDIAHPSARPEIEAELAGALHDTGTGDWIEIPVVTSDARRLWYELRMQGLCDESGSIYGVLAVMRSIDMRKSLEERLFEASLTDPLTGLTNRGAFTSMLEYLVGKRTGGCLALFDVDRLRAINDEHGHAAGDAALREFARFLRGSLRSDDIISRVGGETFGVLLPRTSAIEVEDICDRTICALSAARGTPDVNSYRITASVGIALIGATLDETMRRAETALFFAKAKGRNRTETDAKLRFPWTGSPRRLKLFPSM